MNTTTNSNKVIKRSIILCWVALALCFLVKICGGNFFAIAVENERFIAVCEYIDKHLVLLRLLQLINYLLVAYLYFCAVLNQVKIKPKQLIVLLPITLALYVFKIYFMYIGSVLEIIFLLLVPICYKKCKWYISLLYQLLYNILGFVSSFVKSIGNIYLPAYSLLGIIFSIDIYFMLILFMLYNHKKEV